MNDRSVTVADARLDTIGEICWMLLEDSAQSASHPMRFPVLATSSPETVDARVLVLRRADKAQRTLEFHTDRRSAKLIQLEHHAAMAWVFYDPTHKLQLRAYGRGAASTDQSLINDRWQALNVHTRRAYAQVLSPGTPVDEIREGAPCAQIEDAEQGKPNFTVVQCVVDRIEWLMLSRAGHQRAVVQFDGTEWSSSWIMP